MRAACVTVQEMTAVLAHLPSYSVYGSDRNATAAERRFRRSLGALLKGCGDHLLNVAEQRAASLTHEQEEILDLLIDHISSIFRRLDREGRVAIAGNPHETVPELEELDGQLLLLAEQALALTRELDELRPTEAWFRDQAIQLSHGLADLSRTTEERNYLLGLGWESEFAMLQRR
jgi:hypothetical protein